MVKSQFRLEAETNAHATEEVVAEVLGERHGRMGSDRDVLGSRIAQGNRASVENVVIVRTSSRFVEPTQDEFDRATEILTKIPLVAGSELVVDLVVFGVRFVVVGGRSKGDLANSQIGRASCRERV